MSYPGARAPTTAKDSRRVFAVSKAGLDSQGHVTQVLWSELNASSNLNVANDLVARAAEVVDALHAGHQVVAFFPREKFPRPERAFLILEHSDGRETLALVGPQTADRELTNIATLA
jgi:hypothetical protein